MLYVNEVTTIQSQCTQYSFLLFLTGEWVYINFCHRKRFRMGMGSCDTSLGKFLCILMRNHCQLLFTICTILVTNRRKFIAHTCTHNKPLGCTHIQIVGCYWKQECSVHIHTYASAYSRNLEKNTFLFPEKIFIMKSG